MPQLKMEITNNSLPYNRGYKHNTCSSALSASCCLILTSSIKSSPRVKVTCLGMLSIAIASVSSEVEMDVRGNPVAVCSKTSSQAGKSNCVLEPINPKPRPISLITLVIFSLDVE